MTDTSPLPIEPLAQDVIDWNQIMPRGEASPKTALLLSIAISLKRIADQGDRVEIVEAREEKPGHPDGWFMHDGNVRAPLVLHSADITVEVELVNGTRATGSPLAFAWQNVSCWRFPK